MEFTIDERGCRTLGEDMRSDLKRLAQLIGEIESQNGMLKGALGEDYEAIARTVRVMSAELSDAWQELGTIISDMGEYMNRVQQTRIALG